MPEDNPHRDETLELLRRANCHYGNTLRDEEDGWTVERAARERNVQPARIVELRAAVRRVIDGQVSTNKSQAGHEDGILRALLHFRGDLSVGLGQHIDTRLARLKAEYLPNLRAEPLRCNNRGANQSKPAGTPSEQVCASEAPADSHSDVDDALPARMAQVKAVCVEEVLPAELKTELFAVQGDG